VKSRLLIILIAVIAFGAFFVGRSFSEDKKMEGMTPEQQAQMEQWMKYSQPDDHHKALEPFVGSWTYTSKFYMTPEAPAQESNGTSEVTWMLGDRYLQENVTGDMGGMAFHGFSLTGYDLIKKEYFSIWFDDMSTAPMISTGQMDADGKVLTVIGTYPDVTKGMKDAKYRTVQKIVSADQHVMEMFMVGDDGKEFKNMEITYSRK
jgi:hypothetical protein